MRLREKIAGFTLVEIMIVMVIIGIIAAMGAPSFSGFVKESRLKNGARSIAVALQTARFKAISANRRCYIDFAPGGLTPADSFFTIWLDVNADRNYDIGEIDSTLLALPDSKGGYSGYTLPRGVKFGSTDVSNGPEGAFIPQDGVDFGGDDKVNYNSRGQGSSSGYIYVTGEHGVTYCITVSSLGAVRTLRWGGSAWE